MSLIYCSKCGKQISDKALACPNCGTPPNTVTSDITPTKPQGKSGASIIIVILAIILIAFFVFGIYKSQEEAPKYAANTSNYSASEYDVSITVTLLRNDIFAKYNVDVILDGELQATLSEGEAFSYSGKLTAGQHVFTFRSASNSNISVDHTLIVERNQEINLTLKRHESYIEVGKLESS